MEIFVCAICVLMLLSCASEPCDEEVLESNNASYLWSWLLDPARLVIFAVSLFIITLGSRRAVHLDKTGSDSETDGVHTLNNWHIILLPSVGSLTLIVFFYFFDFIQFIFTVITTFVSLIALYNLLHPTIENLQIHCKDSVL
ncbi:Signal peptide peptidase-like 3 [Geodia barretti]|uniref:Signal peptide peptidase-like 3 n=1 Tax=Geodia barretti TaxID=519541 RepID=A0AA35S6F8_GEOBA|nr:Signal peptide peptidase-like 3 [Geodia barretti]